MDKWGKEVLDLSNGYAVKRKQDCALVFKKIEQRVIVMVIPPKGATQYYFFQTDSELVDWYRRVCAADQAA